ncbi:MAG: PAS sensor protein, partial [Peptococcaceae bacterium]|nr:PAS sensor protein [Peptococcaceae bacterium]
LYHHEHYNGKGYPEGLAGEDIPLGSRIIAVADAFDAMTTERCYRKARDFSEAINELKKGAGEQFDPKIVGVFLAVLQEKYMLNTA